LIAAINIMDDCMYYYIIIIIILHSDDKLLDMMIISKVEGVPGELRERLHALTLHTPRYENSWYGPLAKFFTCIFSGREWMVKPQPPFRVEVAEAADPDDSFGSYGNAVGQCAHFPDFAICTYTRSLTADVLHIIVEVKRDNITYTQACSKLLDYLDSQAGMSPNAFGIAMAGSEVGICVGGQKPGLKQSFHLDDPEFITFLKAYSIRKQLVI
jgi:hypothetical protein